ncbi:MAG: hypothetical protein H6765_06135 [Candidatus Peribacteria bacterium]|nr:MAG: hypothetical protein H6765_06135 [Candidatus Peribacteria bacterium]
MARDFLVESMETAKYTDMFSAALAKVRGNVDISEKDFPKIISQIEQLQQETEGNYKLLRLKGEVLAKTYAAHPELLNDLETELSLPDWAWELLQKRFVL